MADQSTRQSAPITITYPTRLGVIKAVTSAVAQFGQELDEVESLIIRFKDGSLAEINNTELLAARATRFQVTSIMADQPAVQETPVTGDPTARRDAIKAVSSAVAQIGQWLDPLEGLIVRFKEGSVVEIKNVQLAAVSEAMKGVLADFDRTGNRCSLPDYGSDASTKEEESLDLEPMNSTPQIHAVYKYTKFTNTFESNNPTENQGHRILFSISTGTSHSISFGFHQTTSNSAKDLVYWSIISTPTKNPAASSLIAVVQLLLRWKGWQSTWSYEHGLGSIQYIAFLPFPYSESDTRTMITLHTPDSRYSHLL